VFGLRIGCQNPRTHPLARSLSSRAMLNMWHNKEVQRKQLGARLWVGIGLWAFGQYIGGFRMCRNLCFSAFVGFAALALSGCTGTRMHVSPDPDLTYPLPRVFQSIGVVEIPADKVYAPAGHPVQGFARELELSGIAPVVYYPMRSDDRPEVVLETKIDVVFDPHMGGLLVKSFLTGFTLFLLEPAFWYDFEYTMEGRADCLEGGQRRTLTAKTRSTIGMKWLSLSQAPGLEIDALETSKRSIYQQLIQQVRRR
jgi:hypothetical protein